MLTCKITLPDSPHPVIISKNSRFRALCLARRNEFRFFRLINTFFFSFLAAGFCPKNLAFARKIMALSESGGLQPPQSPWLVRLWMRMQVCAMCRYWQWVSAGLDIGHRPTGHVSGMWWVTWVDTPGTQPQGCCLWVGSCPPPKKKCFASSKISLSQSHFITLRYA